jgi:mannose-1-phosphate guanylyltransferase
MVKAVIMAGGRGERFWPQSRIATPKQLLPIVSEKSMLQETLARISPLVRARDVLVVTRSDLAKEVGRQLPGLPAENIIQEPMGRNTAACIGMAAVLIEAREPDAIMICLPADHVIGEVRGAETGDNERFLEVLRVASKIARQGDSLVTIGIKPTRPETGYGYIEVDTKCKTKNARCRIYKVKQFVEKPDKERAEEFVKTGRYFWNSGIFVWRTSVILGAMKKYMPGLFAGLEKMRKALGTPEESRVIIEGYDSLESVSIDHGIMEKANDVLVIEGDFLWDDIGSWQASERILLKDGQGNVCRGETYKFDTNDCIIVSDKGFVAALGVSKLIVVRTPDVTLVCSKARAQEVKELVRRLSEDARLMKYIE